MYDKELIFKWLNTEPTIQITLIDGLEKWTLFEAWPSEAEFKDDQTQPIIITFNYSGVDYEVMNGG